MIRDWFNKEKKEIIVLLLLLTVTLVVLRFCFGSGAFYAHDTAIHIARINQFSRELVAGQWPVRVSRQMAYNLSYPVFNYTYVLPYFLAALLHLLGLSLVTSWQILIIGTSLLSICFFYLFLRQRFSRMIAVSASLLYLLVPFRFLTVFVTNQLGIIFAFFWIALALYLLEKVLSTSAKKYWLCLAIVGAALISSHLISVFILAPGLLVYFLLNKKTGTAAKIDYWWVIYSLLLALALSTYYLLPAIAELSYVKAGQEATVNFSDHFVSLRQLIYSPWGYWYSEPGFNDQLSFQLGLAQWLVLGAALVYLVKTIVAWWRAGRTKPTAAFWSVLVWFVLILLTIFLMLPQSEWLWQHSLILPKIQHPWRLLLATSVWIPLLAAHLLATLPKGFGQKLAMVTLVLIAFYNNRHYQRPMESLRYSDNDYQANGQLFYGSADIAWEFLPRWAQQPTPEWETSVINPQLLVDPQQDKYELELNNQWLVNSQEEQLITLQALYFPSWRVYIDGQEQSIKANDQGLIEVWLPAGQHQLNLVLQETLLEKIADLISLLALGVLIISFLKNNHAN